MLGEYDLVLRRAQLVQSCVRRARRVLSGVPTGSEDINGKLVAAVTNTKQQPRLYL